MIGRLPPTFSILVPTDNRPHQFRHICLPALAQLGYPADLFKVIMADEDRRALLHDIVEQFSEAISNITDGLFPNGHLFELSMDMVIVIANLALIPHDPCHPSWRPECQQE